MTESSSFARETSLPELFKSALTSASKASTLASNDDDAQESIRRSLANLKVLSDRLNHLSLYSRNETLEDLSTRNLAFMFVPYVACEMQNLVRTKDIDERKENIMKAQSHLRQFLATLDDYEIVPNDEKSLFRRESSSAPDPASRRELKIKQYRKEKEIRDKLNAARARRDPVHGSEPPASDFDLISALVPSTTTGNDGDDDDEDEDRDRELALLLLRLIWAQALSQLESMKQEFELIASAPPEQPKGDEQRDNTWRLDAPLPRGGPDGMGPLLDASGKPLRPFTILPSNSLSERARFQSEVFRPDHRLPTMTMDEYLEEEMRRGNIISGGGPQSEAQLTSKELLAVASEQDGTREGDEKSEEKRREEERWSVFTEKNPKGAGNTMNRG
ncbi:hypothetical protein BOTBODRAFT_29205 [Botryobasidium botryosum FD-172 SS1]|uniref:TAP42-like protein n=1 Tax=Botryobasidium botryosum (strain FD-172 SS1) TaxID=930990 RepID=A0A067N2C7_BOTB1|nr:hypothetical protein BOTBODRAFT_29205 [Botryobasidium botryosum FD-172 SS1]